MYFQSTAQLSDQLSDPHLCVNKIMSPQWSNLVLTAHIPNCETNVLVINSFNIEA